MCQEFKRLLVAKSRRVYKKRGPRSSLLIYAECFHGLPIAYLYRLRDGRSNVSYNFPKGHWQQIDFMQWPELVKDFIAGGGYKPPKRATKEKLPAAVLRAEKAQADLARWEKKLKTATGKVKKLRRRVAYYDRTLARGANE